MELRHFTSVFDIDDRQERLDQLHSVVLPSLEKELLDYRREAESLYGGGWQRLFESTIWPKRKSASALRDSVEQAMSMLSPRERERSLYDLPGARGGKTRRLPLGLNLVLNANELLCELALQGSPAVALFGRLYAQHRDLVLALLEAGKIEIVSDPSVVGPPCVPIFQQMDALLQAQPKRLVFLSHQTGPDWSAAAASDVCRCAFRHLLPIAISLVQMTLKQDTLFEHHHECLIFAYTHGYPPGDQRVTPKLRVEILDRDNRTCQLCGMSAPKVRLHVDHIRPVAEGGKSEPSNLWTLCETCNLGKGVRMLTSSREGSGAIAAEVKEQ